MVELNPVPWATATNLTPSAEEAMENHALSEAAEVCSQLVPAFVEQNIPPRLAIAANLFPSAEDVTETQFVIGALVCVQVAPASVDVKIGPGIAWLELNTTPTNLLPSAEEATDVQFVFGAMVIFQDEPKFVETKIPPPRTAAKSLLPSDDDAIACQFVIGALVRVHVWLTAELMTLKAVTTVSNILRIFIFRPRNQNTPVLGFHNLYVTFRIIPN